MKSLALKVLLSIISLLLIPISTYAFDYVLGTYVYQKPAIPKPAKAETIIDPNFNTSITRVTDANGELGLSSGLMPDYCKRNLINADGTLLMLSNKSRIWYLYDAQNFEFVKKLDPTKLGWSYSYNGGDIEPSWDPFDPNVFYYFMPGSNGDLTDCPLANRGTFCKFDVITDTRTVLYDAKNDYPGATYIGSRFEGEPSEDGRIWAFFVSHPGNESGKTTIVVFDKDYYGKDNGGVIASWDNVADAGDYISVSPSGDYVVIPHYISGKWVVAYRVADFPNTYKSLPGAGGHADFAKLTDGTEVYFYQHENNDHVSICTLDTGTVTNLFQIPCGGSPWHCPGLHFSGNNYDKPGWGVVSTYNPTGLWGDSEIYMVELKAGGKIWRLAHHHSIDAGYWTQSHANINRAGTRIVFGSNWDNASGVIDTYQITLPETWWKDLRTPNPNIFISSYQFNDADAATIASTYGFMVTNLSESSSVATIKATNSEMKAIHYDNALTHGDDYYVYDTITGKKIVHDDWGWYLHDISNPDYRTSLANYIASNLNSYSQFDGVFLDDVWGSLTAAPFHQEGTSVDPNLPPDLVDKWQSHMISLIQEIKTAISDKLLILNCGWSATNYLAYADGQMDENFAHPNWEDPDEFLGVDSWKNHLNALRNAAAQSKYYLAQSGVSDGATQEEIDKLVSYCYGSFLMGVPSNNTFAKHYFCPSLTYSNYYWYSVWGTYLGQPLDDYFEVAGTTDCYRRNFKNGIVLVNPTDTQTGDIDLGGTFYTLGSVPVTQVNLSAREGVILLKDTSPPAPPTGLKIVAYSMY